MGNLCRRNTASQQKRTVGKQFSESADKAKNLKVSTDKQLLLYSYYQQAIYGDCPDSFSVDPVRRAKNEAWRRVAGMEGQFAEMAYIELVKTLEQEQGEDSGGQLSHEPWAPRICQEEHVPEPDQGLQALLRAVDREDVHEIERLAGTDRSLLDKRTQRGVNALQYSVDQQKVAAFDCLVKFYDRPQQVADSQGMSLLDYALIVENKELIRRLVQLSVPCDQRLVPNQQIAGLIASLGAAQ